jgi:DNA replication initiation complex subunit (GINS family)
MTITYEALFEVLRKERNNEDLQKLDADFFSGVKSYIEEKSRILSEKPRLDQFMEGYENEQNATRIQLQNIRKIVKDIFDRRERKIIDMAINKAKTGSNIIDTSSLLQEEKELFNRVVKLISEYRYDILEDVILGSKSREEQKDEPKGLNIAQSEPDNKAFKKVQILETVPKFVGVDLEIYGPYSTDEELELHPDIAEMLVKTSKAKVLE